MKKYLLLTLITLFFALGASAQKNCPGHLSDAKKKELREFKMKFMADELELTPEQRKQFEDLYSQMEKERREVKKKIREIEKSLEADKKPTEADYDKASKEITEAKAQMTAIEQKYDAKFAKFLSKKQIYKLKEAEETFQKKMRNCLEKRNKDAKPKKK